MGAKTICFVAGKSGGHIVPCLTVLSQYKKTVPGTTENNHDLRVLFFSADTPIDKKLLANNTQVMWHVMLSLTSFKQTKTSSYMRVIWHCIQSLIISFFYVCKIKPAEVITTGGIVAIPVCFAAFILRIPITIYSLDAIPGKAIRMIAPFATTINICFKSSEQFFSKKKCILTTYPIKFNHHDKSIDQITARRTLDLDTHKKTILFLGGSQGSLFLNRCAEKLIAHPSFSPESTQIIHQTGNNDTANWPGIYRKYGVTAHVFSYSHDLAHMYNAADYVICRAGAGTLFEVLFFEKKCIVIPLRAHTTDHQIDNARAITQMYPHFFECILQEEIEKKYELLFSKVCDVPLNQNFDCARSARI